MQLYFGVVVGVWSYNSTVHAWEPVIEPWNLIINGDLNTGQTVSPPLAVVPTWAKSDLCSSACAAAPEQGPDSSHVSPGGLSCDLPRRSTSASRRGCT